MNEDAFRWGEDSAKSGMSAEKLAAMRVRLAERDPLDAFLVIRHDAVAGEWYRPGCGRRIPHWTASLTKSLVGSTCFLLALQDGRVRLDEPASRAIPGWRAHPLKSRITLRHLVTHSSGLADAKPKEDAASWTGRFWVYPDHYRLAAESAPLLFEPGARDAYSNPGMALFGYCLTDALREAPETDLRTLLRDRVMRPLGVPDREWILDCDDPDDPVSRNPEVYGAGQPARIGDLSVYATWGGASFSPDAAARLGRLFLRHGRWGGRQILEESWVREALRPHGAEEFHDPGQRPGTRWGLGWRLNANGCFPRLPRDALIGAGRGMQILLVVPSLDLIAVRFGQHASGREFWSEVERFLLDPLVDAIRSPGAG